ncbi:MAG: hypothetical protein ACRC2B_05125 [Rubrivivax sp.]
MKKLLVVATITSAASLASAHEGHGMDLAHWHATDAWGFVLLGAVAALLVWLRRGK